MGDGPGTGCLPGPFASASQHIGNPGATQPIKTARVEMTMATKAASENEACAKGRHRPRRVPLRGDGATTRTTCRDCGCLLVRTLATRRWFYSGPLA